MANEESLSTEMFRTALKLAHHRDLFATADPTLTERRVAFLREIDEARRSVAVIADIARQHDDLSDEFSGVQNGHAAQ
jgi:glycerol-3-phosphate O-acyltransferase